MGMLGDAILLIPSLRALREKFPAAQITILCSKANVQIFQSCPYLDEKVVVNFTDLLNPIFFFKLIIRFKRTGFDLTIDFEQWSRVSAIISLFSCAKERIGFKTEGQYKHWLFTNALPHMRNRHEIDLFLDLLRPLGIETDNKNPELFPSEAQIKDAQRLLESQKINTDFVILHTEVPASGRQRQWPIENFAEVGNRLREKYNFKILIASTYKASAQAQKLNSLLGGRACVLKDVPVLTLYVIVSKARLVLTNNSGFMHLAASAGVPVFALHGPTSPIKWGPWGKKNVVIKSNRICSPCLYLGFEYGCSTNKCMQDIRPEQVLEKIDGFLAAG
jgi:heptosyltransferase I